jgi:hypothetical protein
MNAIAQRTGRITDQAKGVPVGWSISIGYGDGKSLATALRALQDGRRWSLVADQSAAPGTAVYTLRRVA